ncbi:hypothetical protein [Clostridium chrysemydis]|uniref:hypothetical protein n=1 Tax=Clostridium chrysemydis TaxID=2665504 RepID=UPI0018837E29|nr:hypothetical protein [Clostridium chrysemydis]
MKRELEVMNLDIDKYSYMALANIAQMSDVIIKAKLFNNGKEIILNGQTITLGGKTQTRVLEQTTGISIVDNIISIDLKNDFVSESGKVEMDLTLKDSDGQLTTAKFLLNVTGKILSEDSINAKDKLDTIEYIVKEFSNKADSAIGKFNSESKTELDNRKTEWDGLKKIAISENNAVDLQNQVNSVSSQLSEKATKKELQAVASGSPKAIFNTLLDLKNAFPLGNSNIYLVLENGNWYYWNTEWISGGIYQSSFVSEGVNLTNIIVNGNFINTESWDCVSSANGTLSALNNELIYTVNGLVSSSRIQQNIYSAKVGHKYYIRADIKPKYANTTYTAFGGVNTSITPIINEWNSIKSVVTAINNGGFKFYHPTNNHYVIGDTFSFRNVIVVDLTSAYGVGKEPTIEEFEKLLELYNGWFDKTIQVAPPMSIDELVKEVANKVDKSELEQFTRKKIITVGSNGVRHFYNLRNALESISNASRKNQYEIQLDEGVYDVGLMYTKEEVENTNFKGLAIQDYISLVGVGLKEKTIIKFEIPLDYSNETQMRVAPIANMGNGDLKNLTVIGKNCRYTIHDDYAYENAIKHTENCTFIKLKGTGNSQAWGEGTGSGMQFYFKDCEFITEYNQAPYSTHNNLNHNAPTYHRFDNCKFKNAGGYFGMRFITLDSGQIEKVDIINCYIDGIIKFEEYQSGDGCRYDFYGSGNSEILVLIDNNKDTKFPCLITDRVQEKMNGGTTKLYKGELVKLNNDGSVILKAGNINTKMIYGIALEDIEPSAIGKIKLLNGYIASKDLNLNIVTGDTVGVENGILVKNAGVEIGIATSRDFVKLY